MISNYYGVGPRREVASCIPQKSRFRRVLEIGCGTGGFRGNFNCSCEYWGIEPCLEAAALAKLNIDRVLTGTLFDVENLLPDRYFELVICNDVIEHIESTESVFSVIRRVLASDGLVVASVPNVRYSDLLYRLLIQKDWNYIDSGILDKTHLRFFTQKSFLRQVSLNGFKVVSIDPINPIRISFGSLRDFCYSFLLNIISLFFGSDTRFPQFVFMLTKTCNDIV